MPIVTGSVKEQIRNANNIVDVIGAVLPLKKSGASFVALCPFHREKTPSFHVLPAKQIFHCFGCQKGGDVFDFVQQYENLSFPEALQRLADRARIPLEFESSPEAQQRRSFKEQLLKVHEAVCQRWQRCLASESEGEPGRHYLEERGLSPEMIETFRIGMAPNSWEDTVNWARSKSHPLDLLESAGLVGRREKGGYFDRFRGRLIFPICDEQGRVIAFSGRVLPGIDYGQSGKYVNSPETPLFTKSRVLFGLDKARRAIVEMGRAVICEGPLDVIACHRVGIRHTVAPQGTALTSDQARILRRYTEEVAFCFDGDPAGQKAGIRALDSCLEAGLAVQVIPLPASEDPDSLLRSQGPEGLRQCVDASVGFFDFYLQHLCATEDPSTDRGRSRIVKSMAEKLWLTGNAVLIDTHAQRTAQRLSVGLEAVRKEFARSEPARGKEGNPRIATGPGITGSDLEEADLMAAEMDRVAPSDPEEAGGNTASSVPIATPSALEWEFLKRLFQADSDLREWVRAHLDPNWLTQPDLRHVVEVWLHLGEPTVALLLDALGQGALAAPWVTAAAAQNKPYPELDVQLADTICRLRNQWIDRQIDAYRAQLMVPNLSDSDQIEILRRLQELKAWKRQGLAELGDA